MKIIDIPNESLIENQKAYNCSIVKWREKTLMYYRYETRGGDYNTDIAVCELDPYFQPIPGTNKPLRLTRSSSRVQTLDDPRAVVWGGRPIIVYPQGCVMQTQTGWIWACSMSIARMVTPHETDAQWLPKYGRNINASSCAASIIATEKNWTPFVHDERLMLVYTINPLVILEYVPLIDQTREVHRGVEFIQSFWKFGDFLGGGTPLLRKGDEFVGFFHSFTNDFPHRPDCRTYHIGFYAISAKPPYRVTRMSRKPIMSATHDHSQDLRNTQAVWRPNCVYPCGWLERDSHVYMSYGWQDCRCKIAEMTWEEIEECVINIEDAALYVGETVAPEIPKLKNKKRSQIPAYICSECHEISYPPDQKTHTCK